MESTPELSGERGIVLVASEESLDEGEYGFDGKEKIISDLGIGYLVGSRNIRDSNWYGDKLGISIIDEQVVMKEAKDLVGMELFEIGINVDGLRTQTTCRMSLSKYGLNLEGELELMYDELEEDPYRKNWGNVDRWKIRGDDRDLIFFAPADPKFLSQLLFSFGQSLNLPKNH